MAPWVAVSGVLLQMEEVIFPLIPELLLPTICLFQLDEELFCLCFPQLLLPLVGKDMLNYMVESF